MLNLPASVLTVTAAGAVIVGFSVCYGLRQEHKFFCTTRVGGGCNSDISDSLVENHFPVPNSLPVVAPEKLYVMRGRVPVAVTV
jgi:hypothetical protein